ncbi:MAG: radical SAM family heme chaperone HemW [Dehalococcoidales bacterium]|nr:radical SAM family heme chaperone HemW [Dehalococcoidales bacterium]
MRGLYIHIPFCVRKCAYCDFYSLPLNPPPVDAYLEAVLREADGYAGMTFQTLYLGGGTPSLLGGKGLRKLIERLRRIFDLSALVEATIEVNPESATDELRSAARDSGITRISIGVQSLADGELAAVGRVHNSAQALDAVRRAGNSGIFGLSADLIIGLPGQDWLSLRNSLETLTGLGVNHLSLYCLSLEEGTPLAANPPVDLPPDDRQAELFEQARLFLEQRGFRHYEISNFAVKGHECLHNLNYWRGGEYLGLGPASASHIGGRRFKNAANLYAYLVNPAGQVIEVEELNPVAKACEEAMLRLRLLAEGLDMKELSLHFGATNTAELAGRLGEMAQSGLLVCDGATYRLPPSRVLVSNPIFGRVLSK